MMDIEDWKAESWREPIGTFLSPTKIAGLALCCLVALTSGACGGLTRSDMQRLPGAKNVKHVDVTGLSDLSGMRSVRSQARIRASGNAVPDDLAPHAERVIRRYFEGAGVTVAPESADSRDAWFSIDVRANSLGARYSDGNYYYTGEDLASVFVFWATPTNQVIYGTQTRVSSPVPSFIFGGSRVPVKFEEVNTGFEEFVIRLVAAVYGIDPLLRVLKEGQPHDEQLLSTLHLLAFTRPKPEERHRLRESLRVLGHPDPGRYLPSKLD